jgi:hypothetical protein
MAITVDTANISNATPNANASSPQTWNHTTAAGVNLVVVCVSIYDTSSTDGIVSTVTFDGKGLTEGTLYYDSLCDGHVSIWWRANSDVGNITDGVVSVAFGGTVTDFMGGAVGATGSVGTFVLDAAATPATGTSGDPQITWDVEGEEVLAFCAMLDDQSVGSKVTEVGHLIYKEDVGSDTVGAEYCQPLFSAFPLRMVFTDDDGDEDWVMVGLSLRESGNPTTVLDTAEAYDFGSDNTPDLLFTGTDPESDDVTYNIQIAEFATNQTYDTLAISANDSTVDMMDEAAGYIAVGQSVEVTKIGILKSCVFELQRSGSPTGTIEAQLLEWGQGSNPGSAKPAPGAAIILARSATVDVTTISNSALEEITFTFSGDQQVLMEATDNPDNRIYFIVVEYLGGDTSNKLLIGIDTDKGHAGNQVRRQGSFRGDFFVYNTSDVGFVLTADIYTPVTLDKSSDADAGFSRSGDSEPFTSGEQTTFTVQSGDALSTNTYYWRCRGKDKSGSNTDGWWSDFKSFIVTVAAGWTGKIKGVTNPSKINGIAVANLTKVNGI